MLLRLELLLLEKLTGGVVCNCCDWVVRRRRGLFAPPVGKDCSVNQDIVTLSSFEDPKFQGFVNLYKKDFKDVSKLE